MGEPEADRMSTTYYERGLRFLDRRDRDRARIRRAVQSRDARQLEEAEKRRVFAELHRAFDVRELDDRDTPYGRARDARRFGIL